MADQVGNSQENSKQEVDIDELEVEVFIIAKNTDKLKATVSFLERRGWPCSAMSNMSKAIEYIADKKPDFVLVSLNHPNPAMAKLPDIITQSFKLTCVAFAEGTDAATANKLNRMKIRHKIFGQPSGPNVQRSIRRILAEKFNVKLDDHRSEESSGPKDKEKGAITIRGGKNAAGSAKDRVNVNSAEGEELSGAGHYDGTDDSGSDWTQQGDGSSSNGGVIIQKGQTGPGSSNAHLAKGKGPNPDAQAEDPDTLSNGKYSIKQAKKKSLKSITQTQEANEAKEASADDAATKAQLAALLAESQKAPAVEEEAAATEDSKAALAPAASVSTEAPTTPNLSATQEGNGSSTAYSATQSGTVPSAPSVTTSSSASAPTKPAKSQGHTMLEIAVESTFNKLFPENPEDAKGVEYVNRVMVFPVDSPSLPGYLVITLEHLAPDKRATIFSQIEDELRLTFASTGVQGKLEKGVWVDLNKIQFQPWATATGTFNLRFSCDGTEVHVAFFANNGPLPKVQPSQDENMCMINIKDIAVDRPVNFRAYLHLEKNDKYFLYLRNGRTLQEAQKLRLKEEMPAIHVKKIELENVRTFFASAFLSASSKDYEAA